MHVLCACISMYHIHVASAKANRRSHFPGTKDTGVMTHNVDIRNQTPSSEREALLTAEAISLVP